MCRGKQNCVLGKFPVFTDNNLSLALLYIHFFLDIVMVIMTIMVVHSI